MARNGPIDRVESAANITLLISKGATSEINNVEGSFEGSGENDAGFVRVPISRLDVTKDVEISEVRESSLKASGYSVTSLSYSGSMSFMGSHVTKALPDEGGDGTGGDGGTDPTESLNNLLYDNHGVPVPVAINISHDMNGEVETYQHVLVTSEGYESQSESETETSYDFVAMDRAGDQPESAN